MKSWSPSEKLGVVGNERHGGSGSGRKSVRFCSFGFRFRVRV